MKFIILSTWLVIQCQLAMISCDEDGKEVLPKATQEGKGTFGCKVNGKVWVPKKATGFGASDPILAGWRVSILGNPPGENRNVFMYITRPGSSFNIYVKNVVRAGRYELRGNASPEGQAVYPRYSYGRFAPDGGGPAGQTDTVFTGFIDFTKADTVHGILSGTFQFKAKAPDGKVYDVTGGRFDF